MKKKCPHCNVNLQEQFQFCPGCGKEIVAPVQQSSKRKKQSEVNSSGKSFNYVPIVIIGLIIVGITGVFFIQINSTANGELVAASVTVQGSYAKPMPDLVDPNGNSAKVREIASWFYCGCGNCGEPELTACTCGTAKEERAFISRHLNDGKDVDEIRKLVYQKYGYVKEKYAHLF